MPLHIKLPEPLYTFSGDSILEFYAIVDSVSYARRGLNPKTILFRAGYYLNEPASAVSAPFQMALQIDFSQVASPEEANAVPIFTFLEQALTSKLTALLPAGTTFANVA